MYLPVQLIEDIDYNKGLKLSEQEKTAFAIDASIGVPFSSLKQYLAATPEEKKAIAIPTVAASEKGTAQTTFVSRVVGQQSI